MKYVLLTWILLIGSLTATPRPIKTFTPEKDLVLDGSKVNHKPGDVFAIKSGKMQKLTIKNFTGTSSRPITFINTGGILTIDNTDLRGGAINIVGCNFVRLSGSGVSTLKAKDPLAPACGIRAGVGKNGPHTINVIGRSSDIEIDHIEVFRAGFAGFNVKDEPKADLSTNRENFTMYNISIHDNHIHDTIGEGFYIGHTFYGGYDPKKTGKPLFPHVIKGLRVYNNYLHDIGCEAIQIGSAEEDVELYNNTMLRTGKQPFAKWQDNGVQIGAGTQALVYNNFISDVPSSGFTIHGKGKCVFVNNVIHNTKMGMYINTKGGDSYLLAHNTIVNAKEDGIRIGNWRKPPAPVTAINNLILVGGVPLNNQEKKAPLDEQGTWSTKDIAEAGFADAAKMDFRLTPKSKAARKGKKDSVSGFKTDANGVSRPARSGNNPGAYNGFARGTLPLGVPRADKTPTPWKNKR